MAVVTTDQQRLEIVKIKKEKGQLEKKDILDIKDPVIRQRLIRENIEMFTAKQ